MPHASSANPTLRREETLTKTRAGFLALCLCAIAVPAGAQQMQWTDKGFISVNGGAQAGSHDLTSNQSFDLYSETATITTSQKVKSGGYFDLGFGYKIWENLLVGASYSHVGSKSDVAIAGSIPDPVFFDQPRSVTASVSGAKHSENVFHIDATWMMPVTDKIDVGFMAGPSIFSVKQDLVTALTVSEPGPVVQAPAFTSESKTSVGFNAGVDVTYLIGKRWGVGGLARFAWGSPTLPGGVKLTVGGFQIAGGFRMRF
jgi:hypothetical protein